MKSKKKLLSNCLWIIAIIGVFISLYFFFVYKHPMYVYDTDDWYYISRVRMGIPIPGAWNPNRVLPEVLMPLVAELGIDFLMPITGDYLGSIATATGIVLSLLITVYAVLFARLFKNVSKVKGLKILMLPTIVMLHFLPFFTEYFSYAHMFIDHDVTCVFYYTISALVNSSLVLFLWNKDRIDWKNTEKLVLSGLLVAWMYISIYSNVFQSIIFASFMATLLIENIIDRLVIKKEKPKLISLVKDNLDRLIVVLVWLVSLIFEAKGGRSDSLQFSFRLKDSILNYISLLKNLNKLFILFIGGSILLGIIIFILSSLVNKSKSEDKKMAGTTYIRNMIKTLACYILTTVFLIIICGKVNVDYLLRPSVAFGSIFYMMLLAIHSLIYAIEMIPAVTLVIPVAMFVLISEVVVTRHNYLDIYTPEKSKAVGEDIVNQVLEAREAGLIETDVYVPNDGGAYWPFDLSSGGEKIANSLYNNGITDEKMIIHLYQR